MLVTIQTQGAYLRGGLPPHVVRRVREYVDNNLDQRIKIETLARLANLSGTEWDQVS
jgi:AraC-like DNA-binding protein